MSKKEKSPYEIKMSAERRDKSFRKNVVPKFSREEFNKFTDVNGNNYDNWLKNRKDTPMNRHRFYKRLSMEKRNDLREQAERDIYPNGIDNYPTRKQGKAIAQEHPITIRKTKEQKIQNEKRENFIKKERKKIGKKQNKSHVILLEKVQKYKNLPVHEALFKKEYPDNNWFNQWKNDKGRDKRKLTEYETRIEKAHKKHPEMSLKELRKVF